MLLSPLDKNKLNEQLPLHRPDVGVTVSFQDISVYILYFKVVCISSEPLSNHIRVTNRMDISCSQTSAVRQVPDRQTID